MTDPGWREREVRAVLDELVRDVAGISTDLDGSFFEAGLTSALLVEIHGRLQSRLGRAIPVTDLFEHPNRRALARHLAAPVDAVRVPAGSSGPVDAAGPIAVVGMAARFPGARDVEEFWRNLVDGRESVTFWDEDALRAAGVDEATAKDPDYVPAAPVMPDADQFDAGLFGMTRREAELCDPQLRVFLEICHQALESAGYDPFAMPGRVGVFGAAGPGDYLDQCLRQRPDLLGSAGILVQTLNRTEYLATQAAYRLNLRGPAMTVLTACSSTLVAVHLACQALRAGECDAAIAGGSVVRLPYGHGYLWTPEGLGSRDGHCRPFDADASGTVFGSGAGAVVLKRLDDAYAGGDDIRAIILGSAVNNDGAEKVSFSAPSVSGQAAVVVEAMALAGVAPAEVGYVEANATGTALGDPVEVAALAEAYRSLSEEPLPPEVCALGAVKSNIGHLDAAAGVAGLVKTVLALERGAIPGTAHLHRPNPRLALDSTPFTLADGLRPWPRDPARRRVAGVTSLGIGGTNAHLMLAEGPPVEYQPPDGRPRVVVWSAASAAGEQALRGELGRFFARHGADRFPDAVATLQYGRSRHRVRAATVCQSAEAAAAALAGGRGAAPVLTGAAGEGTVAFLMPGQGTPQLRLASGLYGTMREFTVPMDECLELFEQCGVPLYKRWTDGSSEAELADPTLMQPLLFAVPYALAQMWRQAGVQPAAVVGDGVGELAAATIAGVFALPDAVRLVAGRAAAMAEHADGRAAADRWAESFAGVAAAAPELPCYRAGGPVGADELAVPRRWTGALADPVPVDAGLGALLTERRPGALLELGPAGTLTSVARRHPDLADAVPVATLGDGGDDRVDLLTAAARLWVLGCPVDWAALDQPAPSIRVAVPGYPYERKRYWADRRPEPAAVASAAPDVAPEPVTAIHWVERGRPTGPTRTARGSAAVVLLPDDAEDERRILLAAQRAGLRPTPVRHGEDYAELAGEFRVRPGRQDDLARVLDRLADAGISPEVIVHAATCRTVEPAAALQDRLRTGFFSLLAVSRAMLGGRRWPSLPRLVLVSRHAVDVSGGEPVDPARAALHGLLRTVLVESPGLRGTGLDIDGRVDTAGLAGELAGGGREPAVALRGRRRWLPVERPVPLPPAGGRTSLREHGVYLITGGTGRLGPAVAAGLAATGLRPRIALLGRRADAVSAERLAEIRAGGAEVDSYPCDVTDRAAVERVAAEVTARWGAVNGLFHLAGLPGGAPAEAVLAPKTAGTEVLERVLASEPALDFAVFFSSAAAVDGLVGAGDYAAASAYLDGAATASPLAGGRVLSIGWPVWRGTGMAAVGGHEDGAGAAEVPALVWERELSDATEWALDEHRLGPVPVLPGSAFIDLAVRAFRQTARQPADAAIEMSDVVFHAPLWAPAPRLLRAAFRPAGERFDLVLESRPAGGGDWSTHLTAHIEAVVADPAQVDVPALQARFDAAGRADPATSDRQVLTRGPRWRNITGRRGLADERLLRVELPPAYHGDLAGHVLHPALLDTATAAVCGPDHTGLVPARCRRMMIYAPLPARLHAHARGARDTPSGDVDLIADDGSLLVRVEGIRMTAADPERFAAPSPRDDTAPAEPSEPPQRPVPGLDPGAAVGLLLRMLDAGIAGPVLVRPPAPGGPDPVTPSGEPVPATPPVAAPSGPGDAGESLPDRLRDMWQEILGVSAVEPDQDFFDAGGNSLSAVDLMARIRETFGVELSVRVMLRARTLGELEAAVRAKHSAA